ncbi:MAG: pyridoxamine 5'-phosphate oxidase [Limimaricola sp.]|uniref:pyridoxamine 5'-phosphate oxidase family protein n=1 Tax=Limimaricola sp. TaxID=2211665 RepID=UPI001E0527D0|nr:pyridoxamine 5'-phosphate oxidase family protein [Limimaricola sp.]MBI1418848.1 pyridoxamine 5'-phosphate oxidase [Limimaricola sp.]
MTDTLADLLDLAWQRLALGVADRNAPARYPVLATLGADGWPAARTVVLRAAQRIAGVLEIHTDTRSAKVASLHADPRAEIVIWDPAVALQMRLRAEVAVLTGSAAAPAWADVPDVARGNYGSLPAPGTPIPTPLAYEKAGEAGRFAVLRAQIVAIDLLHIGPAHRRARFRRADGWTGEWLAP